MKKHSPLPPATLSYETLQKTRLIPEASAPREDRAPDLDTQTALTVGVHFAYGTLMGTFHGAFSSRLPGASVLMRSESAARRITDLLD